MVRRPIGANPFLATKRIIQRFTVYHTSEIWDQRSHTSVSQNWSHTSYTSVRSILRDTSVGSLSPNFTSVVSLFPHTELNMFEMKEMYMKKCLKTRHFTTERINRKAGISRKPQHWQFRILDMKKSVENYLSFGISVVILYWNRFEIWACLLTVWWPYKGIIILYVVTIHGIW